MKLKIVKLKAGAQNNRHEKEILELKKSMSEFNALTIEFFESRLKESKRDAVQSFIELNIGRFVKNIKIL